MKNIQFLNDGYFDDLEEKFPMLFESKADLINTIFLTNISKEEWGNYSLAKLTHDVINQFEE